LQKIWNSMEKSEVFFFLKKKLWFKNVEKTT